MTMAPTEFDGLAERYDRFRPDYPDAIMAAIVDRVASAGLPRSALDVGAGTGISTRALARALARALPDWRVIAVEPGRDMAATARATLAGLPHATVIEAPAEALPVEDSSQGLVLAAQAAHWFDRPRFFAEAARVLAPGGVVAILFNTLLVDEHPALAAAERYFARLDPAYQPVSKDFPYAAEMVATDLFGPVAHLTQDWTRAMARGAVADLLLTRSWLKALVARLGRPEVLDGLIACLTDADPAETFDLPYRTDLWIATRK